MFTLLMQKVPIFMRWIKYLSFVFYGFRLLEKIQYSRHQTYGCSTGCESIENSPALRGLELNSGIEEAWVLLLMAVGYRVISYMCLRRIWSTENKMESYETRNTCWSSTDTTYVTYDLELDTVKDIWVLYLMKSFELKLRTQSAKRNSGSLKKTTGPLKSCLDKVEKNKRSLHATFQCALAGISLVFKSQF